MKQKNLILFSFILLLASGFCSCEHIKYPETVQRSIVEAGNNKEQILKILNHYQDSEDSLKRKAAFFLIANMREHAHYSGEALSGYLEYCKMVRHDLWHGDYIYNSIRQRYGDFTYFDLEKVSNLQSIQADSVINDIDFTFKVWEQRPWHKQYSFNQFCEYVLPFSLFNETPEFNRKEIYDKYNPLIDSLCKKGGSVREACIIINRQLIKDGWNFSSRPAPLPHIGPARTTRYRIGACREMADLGTYVMRALGIPAGNDLIFQWPQRSLGHDWNILVYPNGSTEMFLGAEDSPGSLHFPETKKGKIYRNSYEINPASFAYRAGKNENAPDALKNPFLIDVTAKYVKTYNIQCSLLTPIRSMHVYLTLYNDTEWQPVDWGTIKNNTGFFKDVQGGIVYLPTYYTTDGNVPAAPPIEVNEDGSIRSLDVDTGHPILRTTVVNMIYPPIPHLIDANSLIGGIFQGGNKPDFSDAVSLYPIIHKPWIHWNSIKISNPHQFRYLRFIRRKNELLFNDCNLAELAAYSGGKKLNGRPFSLKVPTPGDTNGAAAVTDNNLTTAFLYSDKRSRSWVALDFGTPKIIDEIRFAPGMHQIPNKMKIIPGHKYKLLVWKNKWKLLGNTVASGNSLTFQNLPSNALFTIYDETDDAWGRIFTANDQGVKWY